jgi:hypothetical protein
MWDCPTFMEVTWEYDDPKLTVTWNQPGEAPVDAPFGAHYKGSKDDLVVRYGDGSGTRPDEKAMSYTPPADGPDIFRSPGHHANWLNCVKTREDPVMNIEAGHRVASMCVLGNIAYRLGRALEWDPATERFVGDEEANRMLSTPGRGPWRL